jgi:hypothetical protein
MFGRRRCRYFYACATLISTAERMWRLRPASNAMCGPARGLAVTRRSGSNLPTQTPDQRGRRGAEGEIGQADARFIEAARPGGRNPLFCAQATCGQGRFLPYRANRTDLADQRGGTEWPAAIRPAKSRISSQSPASSGGLLAEPCRPVLGSEDHGHAIVQPGAQFVRLRGDDREAPHPFARRRAPVHP